MKRFKTILVATDTRFDNHPILEGAAEIAHHNGATLKIVDVVPEFSWITRKTAPDLEHIVELLRQEKKEKLEALVAPIRDKDALDVQTKVLSGNASVQIVREVLRGDHDLVMAVAKGKNSTVKGFFGHTAMRLLRQCPCAVWLITPGTTPTFKHILGCVDTSSDRALDVELNEKVYELTLSISKYHNARFSILHAWFLYGETVLGARLQPEDVEAYVEHDRAHRAKQLDRFLKQYDNSANSENVHLVKGEAPEVISSFVSENDVDLVVMGTLARSGLTGMFMGNTAEKILNRLDCSVLALKPYNFRSPIRVHD